MTELLDGTFLTGAYWGARQESLDDCANRLLTCLEGLAAASEDLDHWFRKGPSRADALRRPVGRTRNELRGLLDRGRQRTELGRELMPELGFRAALWNGSPTREADWGVTCGAYPAPGIGILNHFVVRWPERSPDELFPDQMIEARQAMAAVIEAWDPDWASWITRPMRELQEAEARSPVLGPLSYLGPGRRVPALDGAVHVEAVNAGQLLTIDATAVDLAPAISGVRAALATTGALDAIP